MGNFTRPIAGAVVACAAALAYSVTTSAADDYPVKPVRVVVGLVAGGSADIIARAISQKLTDAFKHPVLVENRPGASGMIAAELVAKANPDGYTLFEASMTTHSIGPHIYRSLSFDVIKDFEAVALMVRIPLVMFINASVPATNLKEFVALTKTNPGKYNYSSAGPGSPPHLAAELLKLKTGAQVLHVPYKGTGAALPDLVGGQVQLMVDGPPPFLPYVKSSLLRSTGFSLLKSVTKRGARC